MPAAVQTFFCHRVQLLDSANKTGLFMVLWCDWISVHQTKPISSRLWGECGFLLSSRGESRKRRRNVQHPHTRMRFSSVGSHNHSATVISVIPRGREKVGCLSVLDDSDDAQCTQHESCFFYFMQPSFDWIQVWLLCCSYCKASSHSASGEIQPLFAAVCVNVGISKD